MRKQVMTRRERLLATFRGEEVDRPPVSFYEIGGWRMAADSSEFNVWNDPSWRPLVNMAENETDIIRMIALPGGGKAAMPDCTISEISRAGDSLFTRITVKAPGKTLTSLTRRDKDVQTEWIIEPLLKDTGDLKAYLELPGFPAEEPDASFLAEEEQRMGENGIICIDTGDPLAWAAQLFSMEEYTIAAFSEPDLFHCLLERFATKLFPLCEQISAEFPGRLWRISGPEYAAEPFLPPSFFDDYVVRYTGKMVSAIQKHGGYARLHAHGRLRGIIHHIAKMKPDALDPLEPPPQGDMTLSEIKKIIGGSTVLMGNIEVSDIVNLPPERFAEKVEDTLIQGTAGGGRGFILQPTASPYGRKISANTLANYGIMLNLAKKFGLS